LTVCAKIGFFPIAAKAEKWRLYPWLKGRGPIEAYSSKCVSEAFSFISTAEEWLFSELCGFRPPDDFSLCICALETGPRHSDLNTKNRGEKRRWIWI